MPLTSVDYSLGLKDLVVSSLELTVHVGNSALMGCVFQSTKEKRVTKVDWMFSSGEHSKVKRRKHYCVLEALGQWCQDSMGRVKIRSSGAIGWCCKCLALELVRTGLLLSLDSWLCNQLGKLFNLAELPLPHLLRCR